MQTTVDLLRHGAVQGGSYYRGRTDDPLTAQGWEQLRIQTQTRCWSKIISSPLCRCLDFAQALSVSKQIPLCIETDFQEFDFGAWEGKTANQLDPQALQRFYQDPFRYPPPLGEDFAQFSQRIQRAWHAMLADSQGEAVLIVTHAGVIRQLICDLFEIPLAKSFALSVDYASLTRLECFRTATEDFVQLRFFNGVHSI